jgi:predicted ArsR family transcriptional regulator
MTSKGYVHFPNVQLRSGLRTDVFADVSRRRILTRVGTDLAHLPDDEQEIQRMVSALGDPTRRRVFFTVREAGELMGKDDVAEAVGITRRLAGFHLDKLVEQGFLRAEFQRRTGRTGPGAGRPAKLYALAEAEEDSRLNVKHYDLLAELLLRAMSDRSGEDPQEVLERVGYEFGRELGEAERQAGRSPSYSTTTDAVTGVVGVLTRFGFGATQSEEGGFTARMCPFEEMAKVDPQRVCGLDRAIWRGVLSAFNPDATLAGARSMAQGDSACGALVVEDDGA